MSSRRSHIVDVTYDDPRTGERVRERRIQEVPYDEFEEIRNRELAIVASPRPSSPEPWARGEFRELTRPDEFRDRDGYRSEDNGHYYAVRRTQRGNGYLPGTRSAEYENYRTRRRDDYGYDSSQDLSRDRRRPRRREHRSREQRQKSPDSDDGTASRLWYSMKRRREGNFAERNFDSSYDGILAGAAGAAIGASASRAFTKDEKNKKRNLVIGAVAGAVAVNAAENWFRIYTEEKAERKQEAWEAEQPLELGANMGQNM